MAHSDIEQKSNPADAWSDPPTEDVRASTRQLLVQRFTLSVIAGPDKGAKHESQGDRMVIGSHEGADFALTDRTVSRFHCELRISGGAVLVRDLESRNGTRVDGTRVLQAHVTSGATLEIGATRITLSTGQELIRIPLTEGKGFGVLAGQSVPMRAVFATLQRAAATDATVLLEGETGTGKELAAESIHRESARRDGPLIVVDCGTIPGDLLESELFGHQKGSFTGAVAARDGAFQAAQGGTLFLDEIGELPIDLQPKLLRVLERREVKRLGTNTYVPIDIRVIAATNRDLHAAVNARQFRADLYYRLAVMKVRLPPLRERPDDLPDLVEAILASLEAAQHPNASLLRSPRFVAELAHHSWPGNVRELKNYVERCLTLRDTSPPGSDVSPSADGMAVDGSVPLKVARERWTRTAERLYLEDLLRRNAGSVAAAARAAGVHRIYLHRLLSRHGLR